MVDRYAPYVPEYAPYGELIDEILKLIIGKGKGLEINTSSFRYGMGDLTTPSAAILKRYQKLGGEIVTFGSDAHFPKDIAFMYDWAVDFLCETGFKYLTVFEQRRPAFVKL